MRPKPRKCVILVSTLLSLLVPLTSPASTPTPNPYLAASEYAITHFDPAATDAFPYAVGQTTSYVSPVALPQVIAGPINIQTFASTSPNYMWAVSTTSVSYVNVANNGFVPVATLPLPGAIPIVQSLLLSTLQQPLTSLTQVAQILQTLGLGGSGGGGSSGNSLLGSAYSLVDNNNVLYVDYNNTIYAIGVNYLLGLPVGLSVLRSLAVSTFMQQGEAVAGMSLSYDGKLLILGTHSISEVDRNFSQPVQTVEFNSSEAITNSMSVDLNPVNQSTGIYIVSNLYMRKVVWNGTALSQNASDGAWISTYSTGDTFPTLFQSGSGSTPALMGFGNDPDQLVVITDGLAQMNLVAFWRNAIPSGFTSRIAGTIPVTCGFSPLPQYIQSDQSVAVNGYGAFVVNNVSVDYSTSVPGIVDSLAGGTLLASPLGAQRFQWNPQTHAWSSVWARPDVSDNTMVPTVSSASNIVFTSGYYSGTGWEVVGLDWNTGQTVHQVVFGPGILGNGFYALIQYLPNGDLLFNSIIGPTRVQLPSGTVYP